MTHLSEAVLNNTTGIVLTLSDTQLVQTLRDKVDFLVLDATARSWSVETTQALIHAAGETPVFLRTANTLPSALQYNLNMGIDGFILCGFQHAAEAERAITACLYPPDGVRPLSAKHFGAGASSLQAMNDQLTLIIEIATPQAAAQITDICEVAGVDGVLISPQKLSVAMDRGFDIEHDEVKQAVNAVMNAADTYELFWGWEGSLPKGVEPSFHLYCTDAEIFSAGLTAVFPQAEEEDETPDGLRAVR